MVNDDSMIFSLKLTYKRPQNRSKFLVEGYIKVSFDVYSEAFAISASEDLEFSRAVDTTTAYLGYLTFKAVPHAMELDLSCPFLSHSMDTF